MKKQKSTVTLKFTPETAQNFRHFARRLGRQQSETLQKMMDFFEINALSPLDKLIPDFTSLEKGIKMRINAGIAILKDIEKTQTKPTHAMIQLLFQEKPSKKEILLEKKPPLQERHSHPEKNLLSGPDSPAELQRKLAETKMNLKTILNKVEVSQNRWGGENFNLKISREELEKIKIEFNK